MQLLYCILIVISFIAFGLLTKQFQEIITYRLQFEAIIITYVFFLGIMTGLDIPASIIKWINELLVFSYFISKYDSFRSSFQNMKSFLFLTSIIVISFFVNNSEFVTSFYYYRFYLSPFLFFIGLYNAGLIDIQWKKFYNYVFFLLAFQILAQLIKVLLWASFIENPVGSITFAGGGVATYIPLIMLGFLLPYHFLIKQSYWTFIWAFGFTFIGIASQKRAAFYFIPIIIISFFLLYRKINIKQKINFNFKTVFIVVMISFSIIYVSAKFNFIFYKTGQDVSLDFLTEHADVYLNSTQDDIAIGRFAAFDRTLDVLHETSWLSALLGYGPSAVKGFERGDNRLEKFGLGGTFPGWSYQFLQVGLLGCLAYILFYVSLFKKVFKAIKCELDPYWIVVSMGTLIFLVLIFMDFAIYSITLLTEYAMTYLLMSVIAGIFIHLKSMNQTNTKLITND